MKKITILLLIILSFKGYSQTATAPSGTGFSDDPYLISSLENLYWVSTSLISNASFSDNKFFLQTNDIDASSTSSWTNKWIPIGGRNSIVPSNTSDDENRQFRGTYNGAGFAISNVTYENTQSGNNLNGFFGSVNGTILNLRLTNLSITTNSAKTGGLASLLGLGGKIYNCSTSGTIISTNVAAGGLVGQNARGIIYNSYSSCNVTGTSVVGGLVGLNQREIYDCYSNGGVTTTANGAHIGGLIAEYSINPLFRSYANTTITIGGTSTTTYDGGLLGRLRTNMSVTSGSNNYWNTELYSIGRGTGNTNAFFGSGLTSAELKVASNFGEKWDFVNTWEFGSDGFPTLVNKPNTWLGIDTNWNNSANWSLGVAPSLNELGTPVITGQVNFLAIELVYIPAGLANYPLLTDSVAAYSITIEDGATIYFNGYTINKSFIYYKNSYKWTGATDSDWNNASNWDRNSVPTSTNNVIIPDVENAPIIGSQTDASTNDLVISEPDGVVINSGATLIVNGTSSGNVTYNRTLDTSDWYLVSSPVSGQIYNDAYVTANEIIASQNTNNRGIATYQNANNSWSYYQAGGADQTFGTGIGYSIKRTNPGNISFTGTINSADVSIPVTTGFNLIGNPFFSYIKIVSFLQEMDDNAATKDIWVWNKGSRNYNVKNLIETIELAPGQSFFVKAKISTNLTLKKSYQKRTGNPFQKTSKTEIQLSFTDGTNNRLAKIFYIDNATTGYDSGYDGETFGGVANTTDVFTHLVTDDKGKKYQIQSLPNFDFETMVVPVGITAAAGKEVTFSAVSLNMPNGIKVFLEDRLLNIVTNLDESNASYKVTLSNAKNGIGRFYLHTKASGVLSNTEFTLNNLSIYTLDKTTLRVVGIPQGKASLKLYNSLGKQVFATSFNSNGTNDIKLKPLDTGVYVVQFETENSQLNKKIIIE